MRRASVRVAIGAAATVAVVYLGVALAVFAIVTNNLTRQVDDRLAQALSSMKSPPGNGNPGDNEPPEGPHDRPIGPPVLVWLVRPSGTVVTGQAATQASASLPASALTVSSPATVTIDSTPVRVAGADVPDGHLVVGQDMTDVTRTQSTLALAEVIIGPVLLVLVFLGAVVVGRRVAAPIEVARRRQLDFSADASHELRTPLSVIEAQTSLALSGERNAQWYRGAFERVSGESRRMRRLLDDLLWLSRFDASHGRPASEPVDLGVLAGQAVDRFRPIAEARGQHLDIEAGDGLAVSAPPDWLDRLLGVLLDNACKYAPDGGLVRVIVAGEGGRATLAVEDSGPGIPEAERGRIFDRFHRATDGGSGAGLGLAIADEIVRATGGRWQIGTASSGGARVSVSWHRARLGSP